MALALDGSAHSSSTGALTAAAALTTTLTNDVIIAFVVAIDKSGGNPSITSVAGGGLTWTKRQGTAVFLQAASSHAIVEEWWAPASAALSAQTITCTAAFTAAADHVSIHVFGVHGCASINSPFDPNASAAASLSYLNNTARSTAVAANVSQVSTTNANSLICSFWFGGMSSGGTNTAGSGMTQIAVDNNVGGTNFCDTVSQYIVEGTVQTNFGTVFTSTSQANYITMADSLTSDAGLKSFQQAAFMGG